MAHDVSDILSQRVDSAIAEYLEAIKDGTQPDVDSFIARHSEIADEFKQFLADHMALDEAAQRVADQVSTDGVPRSTGRSTLAFRPRLIGPQQFGHFELIEEIARGGMGVVYKARQKTPSRTVALKMILSGQFASQADVDRFYAEAQSAAALDHPQIVPVFEVGEHEGQHYFTMALVEGESLAQRLARGPLPAKEAAKIIREVALAVEYAHQHGVIHRDLKPANILLEAGGRVRVTDFGLAKRQTEESGLTRTGELLGTPSFMSPEQVTGDPARIGPVSDVYSLGATLYALLTGRPPFQAASTIDTLKQVVDQDPVPPRELDATIPRDLETITLKCLEKDCTRRYSTAGVLADDLQRFLRDEPIEACTPSVMYRFRKFARRYRSPLAAAALVFVALICGVAVSTWQAVRATRAERVTEMQHNRALEAEKAAKTEAAIATAVNEFLNGDLLAQADPAQEPDREIKLRSVLDRAAEKIESRFANQPLVEAAIRTTLGKTYLSLDEEVEAERHLKRALDLYRQELGEDHPKTLKTSNALARVYMDRGYVEEDSQTLEEARLLFEQTLGLERRVLGEAHPDTLETVIGLATTLDFQERPAEGLALFERSLPLSLARRTWGDGDYWTMKWMNTEANMLRKVGRGGEALAIYQQAFDISRRGLGEEHPMTFTLENNLALSLLHAGQMEEALQHNIHVLDTRRRVLGERHRSTNESITTMQCIIDGLSSAPYGKLGVAGYVRDRPSDPKALIRAVELIQGMVSHSPQSGGAWTAVGMAQYEAEDWNAAIEAWEKSMEVRRGSGSIDWFLLSMAHWQLGHTEQARKFYEQAAQRMDEHKSRDDCYDHFRIDAAELLGIAEPQQNTKHEPNRDKSDIAGNSTLAAPPTPDN